MQTAVAQYQKIRSSTSTPGELLLALYDGLFRFLHGAKHALENGNRRDGGRLASRAHAVVSELLLALDHDAAPELCANLASLYDFCLDRLTTANLRGDARSVEECIRVLTPLREAWKLAVRKAAHEAAASSGRRA